jgi:hypothetical protein
MMCRGDRRDFDAIVTGDLMSSGLPRVAKIQRLMRFLPSAKISIISPGYTRPRIAGA